MKPLNCLLVALWVWAGSRFKAVIWTRRSRSFWGMIPHCGTAHRTGFREVTTLQYVPVKSELGTWRNMVLFFRGRYRVTRWRQLESAQFETLRDARKWMSRTK